MKVCFFLGGFYQNGGIGRVTSMLANCLAKDSQVDITTLCYFNPEKPNIYPLSPEIHQDFFLESYMSMMKLMLTGGECKLRKYLQEKDIDVLIACGALFFPVSVRACRGIKTKCICWEHSDPMGNHDHKGQNFARRYGIKRSDLNVVLTQSALQVYKEKYKTRNTIQIYNPIDSDVLRRAKAYSLENKRIISVGRLTYQKNFEAAIEVAAKILPDHPDWEWDVFGQGEELDTLINLTVEKCVDRQMHFKGQVTDLYERYSGYSIMVMTSRYEGFPMTLLEGMGNGLPLVSFDIPTGPSEIISDGCNGYLIAPFDVECMAKKINMMIDDSEMRRIQSQNCVKEIEKFSEGEVVKKWKDTLKEVFRG